MLQGHGYQQDPHQNQYVPCLQFGDIKIARCWLFCTVIGLVKSARYTNLSHFWVICLHDINGSAEWSEPKSVIYLQRALAFWARDHRIRIVCAPKIAFISFPINSNMCLGAQKNHLIETFLLSTHNICFGWEIRKIIFQYTLLSGGLEILK